MYAREAFKKYNAKINTHDFACLAPLISTECDFLYPTGKYQGPDQIRQYFEKDWDMFLKKRIEFSKANWLVETDEFSVCSYTFYWTGILNGQTLYEKGEGTACFRFENNKWKIIHDHQSFSQ